MRLRALWLVPLTFACVGAPEEEIVHEKEGSTEAAVAAGWELLAKRVESDHPLGNGLKKVIEIEAPDTARKFQIRFSSIQMERDYDFLVVQDEWGNELERVTGSHRSYVSKTIAGRKAKLVLETDDSVASWGFSVDQLRHRGCAHNNPAPAPLRAAKNCTDLRDGIRDLAIKEVRRRFTDGHFGGPIRFRTAAAEVAPAAAPAHSETNTQVAGVDEADIVKTDGNSIYAISGNELRVFRSWPAADTTLTHRVQMEGWPREAFLNNGKLTVFSGVQGDNFMPGPIGRPGPMFRMMPMWWRPDSYTKVTVFDVAGGTPRVQSETLVAGQYVSARRIGDSVRLVLRRELSWPQIQYAPENVEWNTPAYEQALETLEADAIAVVTSRSLADWLPDSYRIENGARVPLEIDCRDYQIHTGGDRLGLTSVVTLNLKNALPTIQDTSLLVNPDQLYQSADSLYVTSPHEWSCYEDSGKQGQFTYVHKLDLATASRTKYVATGGFVGSVLNQFALDEHNGYLRVASTNQRWEAATPEEQSVSRVYVLRTSIRKKALEVVGQTPDLAPGERIYSSRFVGDRGFVVTFRQVDPLFTIDLSNPTQPRVAGELKIPGFSTYLHVLDANHLFAIGNDFETDGTTRNGVALTIFDVSNLAGPRLIHKAVIGTLSGGSEALYDHKAFTMYTEPGATDPVVAIPFTDWLPAADGQNYWDSFKSTLKVFRVSPRGILGLGEIDHSGLFVQNQDSEWGYAYEPNVRRGLFVENFVYALSDAGLRVARIADPRTIVAEVAVPRQIATPTQPTVLEEEVEAKPNVAIPDNDRRGVSATLELTKDIQITSLSIELDVTHTYRGDLTVTVEHNGTTEMLHDRAGGSSDDIKRTFTTERFTGTNSKGAWLLKIVDTASADVGKLNSWKLSVRGKPVSSTPTPARRVDETYSNGQKFGIPDADTNGIRSDIEVPQGVRIESLEVKLDIRHTYRGDLKVTLVHDGKEVVLHNKAGGSADNLVQTFTLSDFAGTDGRGTWTLVVSDLERQDTGTLENWSVHLTGTSI